MTFRYEITIVGDLSTTKTFTIDFSKEESNGFRKFLKKLNEEFQNENISSISGRFLGVIMGGE